MKEKKLKKVKSLVIILKVIIIGYFLFSAYNNRQDFINGFKDGATKYTLLSAGSEKQIVGISQFMITNKAGKESSYIFIELIFVSIISIIAIVLIFQIFRLLNNLQSLHIFDKSNISLINHIIITIALWGIFYNLYLILDTHDKTKGLSIKDYTISSFSITDLDLTFIVYIIIFSIISIIWNYAIDIKSEHSLTV
ncbi:DUF2975 domain-containing protein [Rhizosphaericola mali]|uniref:DUF2975 domain-containing protein n=1 Tax=Rhizosphaericola mali TaxID=2545455 RepID=A0A5P2G3Y4_9BACT|nr:DUF2975 domain-containing protein [Rhizosphaericola mali]QES89917.1 DUF2975 domain-containing protein [Rhizosphaericola mali]